MDYNRLSNEYWNGQIERIVRVLQRLQATDAAIQPGRVVPQEQDLALGTGRRLSAAVMFTDISAFSRRASSTQNEQDHVLRVLNLYFSEMTRIAEEYGGTVEKNTGDGLMTYFENNSGDPPELGSKRAVACALTMMYVNENAINYVLRQSAAEPIQFRVGIDYGPITIAQLGAARRFSGLVAIGTTANIASKMLNHVEPGDILVGEDVYNQLPTDWKAHCQIHKAFDTGWVYLNPYRPYRFFKYTGRWIRPL